MVLVALIPAGFIVQVVARDYAAAFAGAKERQSPQEIVFSENGGGERLVLETMEKLTSSPGQTAPLVTFAVRNFDPETDAVFPADDSALQDIAEWQLQILDRSGRKLHFIQGQNRPASSVMGWYGLSGDGTAPPGGLYSARFVWKDRAGMVHATAKTNFNIFAPLEFPKFAKLNLDLRFLNELELI